LKSKSAFLLLVLIVLSACSVFTPPEVDPWPTGTATALPTETPVWFPATATATPAPPASPVPSATPNQYPGIGDLILQDEFLAGDGWSEFRKNTGSAALGPGELTLSVTDENGYVTIFRSSPTVDDFYMEVQANPRLCQITDSYGLLVRAASGLDYYRFSVSADGQMRADRFKNGNVVVLQGWTPSGQVPRGCPVFLKLGVWAVGDDLRFFVNDVHQFSIEDAGIARGQIGFFARSKSETVLSVTFSELALNWVNQPRTFTTPTPEPVFMLTLEAEEGGH
jgi:hypothetical protein